MECWTRVLINVLPTNASAVAFYRAKYGNELLYHNLDENLSLLSPPSLNDSEGIKQAQQYLRENTLIDHSEHNPTRSGYMFSDNIPQSRPYTVWENVMGRVPLEEKCGIGLYLYFFSLKYFAAVFFLMSLVAIVQGVLDYDGEYYRAERGDWSMYFPCLGNVLAIPTDADLSEAQKGYDKLMIVKAVQVGIDALYTTMFILSILFYTFYTQREIERHRSKHPTFADFSLKLTQVHEARIPEVAVLLETAGLKIHELVPVRHVNKLVTRFHRFYLQQKQHILDKLVHSRYQGSPRTVIDRKLAESNRYAANLDEISNLLGQLNSVLDEDHDVIEKSHSLIVVFETISDRRKALAKYRKSFLNALWTKVRVLFQKCCGKKRNWQKEVNAKVLAVPDEVYWENIRKKQYMLRFFYYYVTAVAMLVSAVIVFLLRAEQSDVDSNSYEQQNEEKESKDMDKRVQRGSIKFLISATIVINNIVMTWLFNQLLTAMEKQSTLPRMKLSAMLKHFFFLLLNNGFLILVVNADFHYFKAFYALRESDSRFDDFTRDWYPEVGFSILFSMLLGVISPHIPWCIYYRIKSFYLPMAEQFFDTQLAYNHWAVGSDMDVAFKTALELVTIYCCFMYAGGMPLMLPVCCLTLVSMFVCDTYLLRFLRIPRERSTILHSWFIKLLPGAVFIHSVFSVCMYSANAIFPSVSPEDWATFRPFDTLEYIKGVQTLPPERVESYSGVIFVVLAAVSVLLLVANCKLIRAVRRKSTDTNLTASQLVNENIQGGDSYYMARNPHYSKFCSSIFSATQQESLMQSRSLDETVISPTRIEPPRK